MKRRFFFLRCLIITAVFPLFAATWRGQTPTPTPQPDETVRITTSLIQIDVVVTDKDGRPVQGLGVEDFKIFQDGKLQKVTNVSFVESRKKTSSNVAEKNGKGSSVTAPPSRSTASGGRILTFVVDDGSCMATQFGVIAMKHAIGSFVDKQMLPGDKVAIYRTRAGSSLMQIYSSNKELIRKKVAKISTLAGSCGSAFEPLRQDGITPRSPRSDSVQKTADPTGELSASGQEQDSRRRQEVMGALGVLRFAVERLKELPGRKSVYFFSEGIAVRFGSDAYDALREVADRAARSSVVVNTVSAKGVTVPGMLTAQDDVSVGLGKTSDTSIATADARVNEERELNMGLSYLSYATGGQFLRGGNFLDELLQKGLAAESSYYLVAYEPEDETFKGKQFHKIDVQVGRPELKVSSRKGFYGRTDKEARAVYRTPDSPMYQALASVFDENALEVKLTVLPMNSQADGTFVRTLVHLRGSDIALAEDTAGGKKASIDIVAVALDEKGAVAEEFNRSYPISIPSDGVATVRENGLDFSTDIPFKNSGVFSLRIAVRDAVSKKVGSAGDTIELPNFKDNKLWVGGLTTAAIGADGKPKLPERRPIGAAFIPVFSKATASTRQFSRNSVLPYAFWIYNAQSDKVTGRPILTREVRLYKDGEVVVAGTESPIDSANSADRQRIENVGIIRLSPDVASGEYILQVIVRDKAGNRVATQSLDFEVVP